MEYIEKKKIRLSRSNNVILSTLTLTMNHISQL